VLTYKLVLQLVFWLLNKIRIFN